MRKATFTFAVLLTLAIFTVAVTGCNDTKETKTVTESVKSDTMAPMVMDTMKMDTATPMPVKPVN